MPCRAEYHAVRDTVPCGLSFGRGAPQFDPPVSTPSEAARPHEPVNARGYSHVASVVSTAGSEVPLAARTFPGRAECAQEGAAPKDATQSIACVRKDAVHAPAMPSGWVWPSPGADVGRAHSSEPCRPRRRAHARARSATLRRAPCARRRLPRSSCQALPQVTPRCNGLRRVATGCAAWRRVAPRCDGSRRASAASDHATARNELRWAEPGFRTVRRGSAAPKRLLVEPHFAALTVPARAAV